MSVIKYLMLSKGHRKPLFRPLIPSMRCLFPCHSVCLICGSLGKFMSGSLCYICSTNSAMSGGMTFKESLQKRLELMRPSKDDITRFIANHPPQLTKGLRSVN